MIVLESSNYTAYYVPFVRDKCAGRKLAGRCNVDLLENESVIAE